MTSLFINECTEFILTELNKKKLFSLQSKSFENHIVISGKEIIFKLIPLPFITKNHIAIPQEYSGYQVIQIWEDSWKLKKDIVQSRILSSIGSTLRIHGRKTQIKRITSPVANKFIDENHINGITTSKFKYGLFLIDELVAVATFSSAKNFGQGDNTRKSYELIRFCSKRNTTVTGGLSKLIQYFIKDRNPDEIMTYIDLEWSNGNGFKKFGFVETEKMQSIDFYIDTNFNRSREKPNIGELLASIKTTNLKLKWFS